MNKSTISSLSVICGVITGYFIRDYEVGSLGVYIDDKWKQINPPKKS